MLTDDQINSLYSTQFAAQDWKEWQSAYEQFLAWVANATDEELLRPESQERLWKARAITPVGPGDSVNVSGAYTDAEIAQSIVRLRTHPWPSGASARADAIESEAERLLALVRERHSRVQPRAKLWRLFAAMLPAEFHCVFAYPAHANTARLLLGPDAEPSHVLIRARLREALGPEGDLAEHVRRSTFCWWLHEQYDALSRGAAPAGKAEVAPDRAGAVVAVWPYGKQFKGNGAPKKALEVYRRIVQEALPGSSRSDLVELLKQTPELSGYKPTAIRVMLARVIGLGLLGLEGELVRPTPAGHSLLENDLPDALVERMIERVFPFAGLLRHLKTEPQVASAIHAHLQSLYPNWTETMGPSQLMMWARVLDLAEKLPDGRFALTAYGQAWEQRLPPVLPAAPLVSGDARIATADVSETDDPLEVVATPSSAEPWPSFDQMRELFSTDEKAKAFVLSEQQLRTLYYAWHCNPQRRFVLLAGLSGTGKTAVLRHFSRLYSRALGLEVDKHVAVVPVSPDWRDPSGLLGYLNSLHEEPTFQAEPALRLLLRAVRNPQLPYFLILDEMNLARVEQYFAPFLSAMEQEDGRLTFHGDEEPINDVPPSVPWPRNLFIAGTVNMDETTHPFSDKVLDRAFTMEFWDVNLTTFFAAQPLRHEDVEQTLSALNEVLAPNRRHFGYRTASEVLSFVTAAGKDAAASVQSALLDQAIFSKVLPRIRGEQTPELEAMLQAIQKICAARELGLSSAKVQQMHSALKTTGLTKFWA